jgi:hypothetical protein
MESGGTSKVMKNAFHQKPLSKEASPSPLSLGAADLPAAS